MSIDAACEMHPAQRAVAAIDAALDDLLGSPLSTLTDAEHADLIAGQEKVLARLSAAILATVRTLDVRGTAKAQGATGTGAWLRDKYNLAPSEANRRVKLAKALDLEHPEVYAALAAGAISEAHAQVITTAVRLLPKVVDADTRAATEEQLLDLAGTQRPGQAADVRQGPARAPRPRRGRTPRT